MKTFLAITFLLFTTLAHATDGGVSEYYHQNASLLDCQQVWFDESTFLKSTPIVSGGVDMSMLCLWEIKIAGKTVVVLKRVGDGVIGVAK